MRLAAPARTLALLLSDVVGDDPSSIASGLTAPDPTTLGDAWSVLRRYCIKPPESVSAHLNGADETPKPGDNIFEGVANVVCGGGGHAAEAAVRKAQDLGYAPLLLSTTVTGDAQCVASVYAAVIREVLETGNPAPPPCALVSGGEQRGNIEERYDEAIEAAQEAKLIEKGDRVILTGGSVGATPGSTNMLKLHTIGEEE